MGYFTKTFFSKKYVEKSIDVKHNILRIKNDLSWLCDNLESNNLNSLLSLYWLDINLKNVFFPFIQKIEREIKSIFIYFYKKIFLSDKIIFLFEIENFSKNKFYQKKINFILKRLNDFKSRSNNIDEIIFLLSFGEFVNLFNVFSDSLKKEVSNYLKIPKLSLLNILKYFSLIRNLIAHNKTILKIIDNKQDKKFSLKKEIFNFNISKLDIDVLSINIAGIIYAFQYFLEKLNAKNIKKFTKKINKEFINFKSFLKNKKDYKFIMNTFFKNYKKNILKNFLYKF